MGGEDGSGNFSKLPATEHLFEGERERHRKWNGRAKGEREREERVFVAASFHLGLGFGVPQPSSDSGACDVGQRASSRRSRVFYEELFVSLEWPRPDGLQGVRNNAD